MKMQKTDIGVVVFMYAVCGFFYAYSSKLSDTSRTYPKFTIALLFFLTSFYLVQMILNARKAARMRCSRASSRCSSSYRSR